MCVCLFLCLCLCLCICLCARVCICQFCLSVWVHATDFVRAFMCACLSLLSLPGCPSICQSVVETWGEGGRGARRHHNVSNICNDAADGLPIHPGSCRLARRPRVRSSVGCNTGLLTADASEWDC